MGAHGQRLILGQDLKVSRNEGVGGRQIQALAIVRHARISKVVEPFIRHFLEAIVDILPVFMDGQSCFFEGLRGDKDETLCWIG